MTFVSTVSGGTTGAYKPYGFETTPYGGDFEPQSGFERSTAGLAKPYGGTGGRSNRCPRSAPVCVSANRERRARRRALCGRPGARRRSGVAA